MADIQSDDQRKIENAVYTFLFLGKEEMIPMLIKILNTKGDKTMALNYLDSGNNELENAAKLWASAHGYKIQTYQLQYVHPNVGGWGSW